ncbi:vWA domain-containing protein [Cytobacillus gottheilii]|uniref:vWA domain-containing protein n=1 Tax=Cytobacillus gottheilii TaxID=859144 RepID=UPI0009BB7457|nr:VWA domain-containing protein [Cytobacillus gottheilii]
MRFLKRSGICAVFILFLAVMTACANEQTQKEDTKSAAATSAEESAEEKISAAARTVEEMVEQKAGTLVEEYMDPELETLQSWDRQQYLDFIQETFEPIVEEELQTYFSENKSLKSEEVYDYLVHTLGSGNYKKYYEELASYDHGFRMPELPDGEDEVTTKQKKVNALVLLDASGSMNEALEGQTKMDLAKAAIEGFVEQIPDEANVSLISYGHVGTSANSEKAKSCAAVETVYPLAAYQKEKFTNSLQSFQASGWTPLAGAIQKAGEILQAYPSEDYYNQVYIVSDGVETCDGDPVAAAKELQNQNIKATVNIIGFDVDNEGQQQLRQVADSGGGEYITVDNPAQLEVEMTKKWQPTLGQLWWTQGVTLNETVEAMERMNDIYSPLYNASNSEINRIKHGIRFLSNEELISIEVKDEVNELADSLYELREEHFSALKETKEEEREQAHEEITTKVEEWRKQWQ